MSASDPINVSDNVSQAAAEGVVSQSPQLEYLKEAMTGVGQALGGAVVGVSDAVAAGMSNMSLGVGGAVSSVSSGVGEVYSNVTENVGGAVSSVSGRMVRCFTLPPHALGGDKGGDDSLMCEGEVVSTPRTSTDSGVSSSFLLAPVDDAPTRNDSSSSDADADSLQEEVVGLCRELGVTETTLDGGQTDVQGRLSDLETRVRALIFDTQAGTRRRRALVHVLVAVREHGQKVSDLSDMAQSVGGVSVKGHLLLQERSHREACDVCTRTIWDILSSSYACAACHLHVHWSCINHMRRYCPSSYFSSSPLASPLSTHKRPLPTPGFPNTVDPSFLTENSDPSFSGVVRLRSASSYLEDDHAAIAASLPTPSRLNLSAQAASNDTISAGSSAAQTPDDGRGRDAIKGNTINSEHGTHIFKSDASGNSKTLPSEAVVDLSNPVSSSTHSSSKSSIEDRGNQPSTKKSGSRSSSKSSQSSQGSRTSSSRSSKHPSESGTSPSKQSPKSLQRLALGTAPPLTDDGPHIRVDGGDHLPLSSLITSICPEVGLGAQNFKCAECKQVITNRYSYISAELDPRRTGTECAWSEPRLCHYSGLYYCPACHWNDTATLPALVVRNWDFTERPVSRCSLQLLQYGRKKPLLDLRSLNPHLFILLQELCEVKKLREDLMLMKQYLVSCRFAVSAKLLRRLATRQHFVDAPNLYSTQDLIDLHAGTLLTELQAVHDDYARHITEECQVCQGRGHICLNCNQSEDVLYPFEQRAVQCSACYAVMHVECYLLQRVCAKCSLLGRQGDAGIIGAMIPVRPGTDARRGEAAAAAATDGKSSAGVSVNSSDGGVDR